MVEEEDKDMGKVRTVEESIWEKERENVRLAKKERKKVMVEWEGEGEGRGGGDGEGEGEGGVEDGGGEGEDGVREGGEEELESFLKRKLQPLLDIMWFSFSQLLQQISKPNCMTNTRGSSNIQSQLVASWMSMQMQYHPYRIQIHYHSFYHWCPQPNHYYCSQQV